MPYRATWNDDGLQLNAYGVITLQDVQEEQDNFYSNPRSDEAKYIIWNSLGAEKIDMSNSEYFLPAVYDLGAAWSVKKLRVALIARDPIMWDLCVHYQAFLRQHQIHWLIELFDNLEEARTWAMGKAK